VNTVLFLSILPFCSGQDSGSCACPESLKSIVSQQIALINRQTELLAKIKNPVDARRIKDELRSLDRRREECVQKLIELRPAHDSHVAVIKELLPDAPVRTTLDEYGRLLAVPAALEVLADLDCVSETIDERVRWAQFHVQLLSERLEDYKRRTGDYPKQLSDISNPPEISSMTTEIKSGKLRDPWGRLLEYDPKGKRNGGARPDVWSLGPPHKGPQAGLVGNWP
jgi:hypothetical protein